MTKRLIFSLLAFAGAVSLSLLRSSAVAAAPLLQSFYDLKAVSLEGREIDFSAYRHHVIMAANTASRCGFTPQYRDLETLYERHKDRGFIVLGFPSNDFGNQEPGDAAEIKKFCLMRFGVTFPLFAKASVSGERTQPVFTFLTTAGPEETRGAVGWNFEKFLIDRRGRVRYRFGSFTNPSSAKVERALEMLLSEPSAEPAE